MLQHAGHGKLVLAFQGGGALGAYQAGILEGLHDADVDVDEICGASIGAANASIFVGNSKDERISQLRKFWETISLPDMDGFDSWLPDVPGYARVRPTAARARAELQNAYALGIGVPGFFTRRLAAPYIAGDGSPASASVFDTAPFLKTLRGVCDVETLNASSTRVSIVATNVATGNARYFDTRVERLTLDMIVASGALPPWFGAVGIGGEWFWDGALATAAPIKKLYENADVLEPTTVLRADLWRSEGPVPDNLADVEIRLKNIDQASRSRYVADAICERQHLQKLLAHALSLIPPELRQSDPQLNNAAAAAQHTSVSVISLDYNESAQMGHFKDGQFGRSAIEFHWQQGRRAFAEAWPTIERALAAKP
jgi:NTE family protein